MTTKTSSSNLYPVVTTVAGAGRRGFIDGTLNESYLDTPLELLPFSSSTSATDANFGSSSSPTDILIVDNKNNCLRNMNLRNRTVTTIPTHAFLSPRSPVLIDGGIVICDSGHNKLRLLVLQDTTVIEDYTIAGTGRAGFHDGTANNATFNNPSGLCVIKDGSILVCDTNNHAIRRLSARPGKEGLFVSTIIGHKGSGFTDGNSNIATLNSPTALCMDKYGTIFICDTGNHAIRILHPPSDGDMGNIQGYVCTTLSGIGIPGYLDHDTSLYSLFREPGGIQYDPYTCNLLVADTGNNSIRCVSSVSSPKPKQPSSSSLSSSNYNLYTLSSKGIIEPVPIGVPLSVERAIFILDSIKVSSSLAEQQPYRMVIVSPVLYPSLLTNNVFLSTLQTIGRDYEKNDGGRSKVPMDILTHADPIAVADVYRRYNYVNTVAGTPPIVIETMIHQLSNNNRHLTNDHNKKNEGSVLSNEELANLAPDALSAVKTIANKVTQFNYNTAQINVLNSLKRYEDGPCFQSRLRRPLGLTVLPDGKGSVLFTDSSNHLVRLLVSEEALLNPPAGVVPFLTSSLVAKGTAALSFLKTPSTKLITARTSSTITIDPPQTNGTQIINRTDGSVAVSKDRRTSVSSTSSGMRDFVATNPNVATKPTSSSSVTSSTSHSQESRSKPVDKVPAPPILPPTASSSISSSLVRSSLPMEASTVPSVTNNHNQHHHPILHASFTSNHHHYSLATESSIRHVTTVPGEIYTDQQLRMEIDQRLSPSAKSYHSPTHSTIPDSSFVSSASVPTSPVSILHQSSVRDHSKPLENNTSTVYFMQHKDTTAKPQNIQLGKYTNGVPLSSSNPSLLHSNTVTMLDKQIAHTVDPVGVGLLAAAALAVPTTISSDVEILAHDPKALLEASVQLLNETNHAHRQSSTVSQRQRRLSSIPMPPPTVPVASTIKTLAKDTTILTNSMNGSAVTGTGSFTNTTTTTNNKTLSSRPIGWKFEDEVATDRKHGLVFSSETLSSRDAVALEEHNTAGYVVKSLLLNAEKTHQHQTTVASRNLINARYARHTSSSASYYRTNGQTVVRNAPAFVNVNRVVQRTIEDLRTKATENMRITSNSNSKGNNVQPSSVPPQPQQVPYNAQSTQPPVDASTIIAAALSPTKKKSVVPLPVYTGSVLEYDPNIPSHLHQDIVPSYNYGKGSSSTVTVSNVIVGGRGKNGGISKAGK